MKKIVSLFLVLGYRLVWLARKQSPKTVDDVYKILADSHLMELNKDGKIELS